VYRSKPDPELYLNVLDKLGVSNSEAIVFEDSPNGILAARRAGIFTVAVPNQITRRLPLDGADLRLESLADLPLEQLLDKVAEPQIT
jgi:putative hydrolase of the HAD superfamily